MNSEATVEKGEIERIFQSFTLEAQKQISSNLAPKKRVIVLAGPTGCGKTDFSIKLAKMIGGEIISADSMQVYRGMDIGTAKPTFLERQEIPHHLIDICNITDSFNVVDFCFLARQACQEIISRGNAPIVVGGSGFYLHSLLYGPPSGPPSVPELRKTLEDEMEAHGPEFMFEKLRQLDPVYCGTITKNDKQKIIRALEIIIISGKKVSKMAWRGRKKPQNYDFHCWFLHRPREHLYKRIEKRCDKMLEEGFLNEVQRLIDMGLKSNTSAAQAIGYRQAIDYLDSAKTEKDYQHFVKAFKQASRNYAKRQFTWFNKEKEPLFCWMDMDLHDQEVLLDIIQRDYFSR